MRERQYAPRDQFQALYEHGPEAVYELLTALYATRHAQQEQSAALSARVQELEARRRKDSHNRSKPPASDGLAKKPVSLRPQTARKPGGQKGHAGRTLPFADAPCQGAGCPAALSAVPGLRAERRQVLALPPLRLHVTAHRGQRKVCRRCGQATTALFPADVRSGVQYGSRVQALSVYLLTGQLLPLARVVGRFADLFGQPLWPGTLGRGQQEGATGLHPVTETIQAGLRRALVAHFDETGRRVAGRLDGLPVVCPKTLTA